MGAEAGNVVARLAVKVTPDTEKFYGDLARKLEAIEKRLRPLEVGVDLDEDGLRERVRLMSAKAQAAVRDVQMGVHFDEREFAKIGAMADRLDDAAERRAGGLARVYDGDMDTIRRHWSAALDAMKRDAAKKLRLSGPHSDEDSYWRGHTDSAFRMWYGRRGEAVRQAFREMGPVEFEMRPASGWQDKVKGLLDGFFNKEYTGRVRWTVDEDLNDVGALRRLRARMEREFTHGWKYVVDPDVDVKSGRVDAALDKLRQEMRERAFGKHEAFHLDIKPHMSDHELREAGRKLKHFKRKWDDTELEFKIGLDHSARYVAAARLAVLARDRWVKLRPVIDHKAMVIARETLAAMSGWRLASDLTHNVWDLVKNLDKLVPTLGAVGSGFAVAGAGATQLLKHTLTLGGAVGHVLQAAALLGPTLAISAGFIGYTAIQAAKVATEIVPGLEDAFHKMNDAAQHGFWDAVSDDQVAKITDSFFPEMEAGFGRLSKAMGGHFGKLVDSFDRVLKPHIAEMFSHSAAGIDVLGEHTDSLMTILGVLGKHGSKTMERFLGFLGQATDRYADWLVEAEKSGRLQQIIDRGIDTLKDFGRAVWSASGILHGFYKAAEAEGGASMKRFADGVEAVNKAVNSGGFQKALGQVFHGMSRAWSSFKVETQGVWAGFGRSWAQLADEAGAAMGRAGGKFTKALLATFSGVDFNKGFRGLFDGLSDGLSRIAGAWPKVSQGLGALMSFMGSLGRGLSPVVGAALEALARAAERLGPALSRAVESGGPALARSIESWGRIATPVAEALSKLVETLVRIPGAVEAVATGFMLFRGARGAASLFTAISGALSGLKADSLSAQDALSKFASGGGMAQASAQAGRFGGALSRVQGAARGLAGGLSSAVGVLTGPWGAAIAVGVTALGALVSAGNAASDAIGRDLADALAKSADGIDGAADKVTQAVAKMTASVSSGVGSTFGGNLNEAMRKYRDNARWQNWLANGSMGLTGLGAGALLGGNASPLDYKSSGAAVNLADAFERIGEVAKSGNVAGAAQALAQLRGEMLQNGASVDAWDKTLDSALGSVDGLKDGLSQYASSLGYATDAQSLHRVVAEQTDAVWKKMQADAKLLADNSDAFGKAVDSSFAKWGQNAKSAEELHSAIERVGRSMIDVGAAARDANGEVIQSVDEVLANLKRQADAQAEMAQNMLELAQAGFATPVLEELAKLPQGAQYLQQLKDALSDTSEEGRARLQELLEATNGVAPALSGMAWGATPALQAFHDAVTGAFSDTKSSVLSALDSLGVDASVKAAAAGSKTADELVKALSDAGVQISQTADGWALTLNGKTAQFSSAGSAAGNAYRNGFKSGVNSGPSVWQGFANDQLWATTKGGEAAKLYIEAWRLGITDYNDPNFVPSPLDPAKMVPTPFDSGVQAGTDFSNGVQSGSAPTNGGAWWLQNQWDQQVPWLQNSFLNGGIGAGSNYASGVGSQAGAAGSSGEQIGLSAREGVKAGRLCEAGSSAGSCYASNLGAQAGAAGASGAALAAQAVAGASSAVGRLAALGAAAGSAFAQGVMSRVSAAVSAAQAMASAAAASAKQTLNEHSPSRVFKQIGSYAGEGFVIGLNEWDMKAGSAGGQLADSAAVSASRALDEHSPSRVFQRLGAGASSDFAAGIRGAADVAVREAEALAGRVVEAGSGVRMRVFDGGRVDVSGDSRMVVRVDPESLRGAKFGLRLSDEVELETFISDVADGRVVEYARMGA